MSNLSNVFRSFLKNNPQLTQIELARKLGIVPSHLTHVLKGRRRGFGPELLTNIVLRISKEPKVQAQFLIAYLRDQCGPDLQHLVDIEPSRFLGGETPVDTEDGYAEMADELRRLAVDQQIVRDLVTLAQAARQRPALARVLQDLAKMG